MTNFSAKQSVNIGAETAYLNGQLRSFFLFFVFCKTGITILNIKRSFKCFKVHTPRFSTNLFRGTLEYKQNMQPLYKNIEDKGFFVFSLNGVT